MIRLQKMSISIGNEVLLIKFHASSITCSWVPLCCLSFAWQVHIGYLPKQRVIGLSKIVRSVKIRLHYRSPNRRSRVDAALLLCVCHLLVHVWKINSHDSVIPLLNRTIHLGAYGLATFESTHHVRTHALATRKNVGSRIDMQTHAGRSSTRP